LNKVDLLLDASNDLVVRNFDLVLTNDKEILPQRIKQMLQTFKGEWFLDNDLGIPYFQEVLGQTKALDVVRSIFIDAVQNVEGVKELVDFDMRFNNKLRTFEMDMVVSDDTNTLYEINYNV
jgi:hypothetical protein